MSHDRPRRDLAREILDRVAHVERLRTLSNALRQKGEALLAVQARHACAPHHVAIARLAHELGLPPLTLEADVASAARAVLADLDVIDPPSPSPSGLSPAA